MEFRSAIALLLTAGFSTSVLAASVMHEGTEKRKAVQQNERKVEKERERRVERPTERYKERPEKRYQERPEKSTSKRGVVEHRLPNRTQMPIAGDNLRVINDLPKKRTPAIGERVTDRNTQVTRYYKKPRIRTLRPQHRRPGYVIPRLPSAAFALSLAGLAYLYHDGLFYRHYPHGYVVVRPPIGALVPALPFGYVIVTLHGRNYYYYEDTYYIWDQHRTAYRVIEEPAEDDDVLSMEEVALYMPGNIVDSLPDGAESVTIEGVQYYEYKRIYFLPTVQNGAIAYIVVNLAR